MIVGNRITKIEGERSSDEPKRPSNFKVNLKDVKFKGKSVEVAYEYSVEYGEKAGFMKFEGVVSTEEEKDVVEELKKEWAEKKRLTPKYTEMLFNAIKYYGDLSGVFVSRVLNLAPPIQPPRYTISEKPPERK
ncbi:MAG: hypothetical protein QXH30_03445 [Candidatus Bilamarchaeaceae archaeon]